MKELFFKIGFFLIIFMGIAPANDHAYIDELKNKYNRPKEVPFPKDNLFTKEKAELGKKLFFDPRLSRSKVMSCATCHNPSFSWTDRKSKTVGDYHKEATRHTPTLLNLAWGKSFSLDGRSVSLEEQALSPIESPSEMGLPLSSMIEDLSEINSYFEEFKKVFPKDKNPLNEKNVAKAIATFERTIISEQAPFDKWILGNENAISEEAKKGFMLFNGKANCSICHTGWNFTDGKFYDIGIKTDDIGRGAISGNKKNYFAFKTPTLRNIDQRFPYMHNGSIFTLSEVIDHYNKDFQRRKTVSDKIHALSLTTQEKSELIAFLKTLTSKDKPVALPILP